MKRATPSATAAVLKRQARALQRHLPAAVKGDDLAVHQARVASRRLRESVPVLSKGLKGSKAGKARRKIRRLTGALGMVRELDVALHVVDELASMPSVPRSAIDDLRAHLLAERQQRRDEMLDRLDAVDTDKLGRRLQSVVTALDGAEGEAWRQLLGKRLLKRAKRLSSAIEEAGHLYATERLHAVRIATKKLRYGLELAADSGIKSAAPLVRTLKRAQELLGRIQDLQVLGTHVTAVQGGSNGHRVSRAGLGIIGQRIEDDCRRLHARYVAVSPALTAACGEVRTAIVPQLAHPVRRRRAIKMDLSRAAAPRRAAGRR